MRKADAPGTYRIKRQDSGKWLLSGITTTGRRMKIPGLEYADAEKTAAEVFGASGAVRVDTELPVSIAPIVSKPSGTDDWGLPIGISVDTAQSVNASLGVANVPQGNPSAQKGSQALSDEEAGKKVKRAKQAKSIMELAGVSWAAGSVWVGRRIAIARDKDPVLPSPRQVNDLAEVTKETFIDWFGDTNVKPWQMMFLLTIGIPLSMYIQSPSRKRERADLKAVPLHE